METLENKEYINSTGGNYFIKVISDIKPKNSSNYSMMFWFEPSVESFEPKLNLTQILHKKYTNECEKDKFSEYDGSNIVTHKPWDVNNIACVPKKAQSVLQELFGEDMVYNTFKQRNIMTNDYLPAKLFDFDVSIGALYNESVEENPTKHYYRWDFKPVFGEKKIEISRCFHKIWEEVSSDFEVVRDDVNLVEIIEDSTKTPDMETLPKDVQLSLCKKFGKKLVKRSVGSLPKYIYSCVNCGEHFESEPTKECINCDKSVLSRYQNIEDYNKN